MANILNIETSTEVCSVALTSDGMVLEHREDYEGRNYQKVVSELEDLGFTNITLKRANDLVTGWITKEGTIKSISINGINDFTDGDSFAYDDEIVIIVHTFKNKGCEDITAIAE